MSNNIKSVAERAYMAKFETFFEEAAATKDDTVMEVFQTAKQYWEQTTTDGTHSPVAVLSEIEDALMNTAIKTPYYDEVRSTMISAQLQMLGMDESERQLWKTIGEDDKTTPADLDKISHERDNWMFRELGNNTYEILSSFRTNDEIYELLDTCAVSHCPAFNLTEALDALTPEDHAYFEELFHKDIRELPTDIQLMYMTDGTFATYIADHVGQEWHGTQTHEDFYPHMLKEYIEQLDISTLLEPDAFLTSRTIEQITEDYRIADNRFRGLPDNPWYVVEDGHFVGQTPEQIEENPNRDFFRPLGTDRYEVLSVHDATAPYHQHDISDVGYWKEFDVQTALNTLDKEQATYIAEQMNVQDLQELPPAVLAQTMLYQDCGKQPHEMNEVGGEFYPHEIPAYMEQLDSVTPLSPSEYQANKSFDDQNRDYRIASERAEKKAEQLKSQKNTKESVEYGD